MMGAGKYATSSTFMLSMHRMREEERTVCVGFSAGYRAVVLSILRCP